MLAHAVRPCAIAAMLLLGCGEPAPTTTTTPAPTPTAVAAPAALPERIVADVVVPGALADRHLLAAIDLGSGLPWAITGCVSPGGAPCEESSRVELDEAGRTELVRAIEEIRAIPRCEPEGIFPGDCPYTLTLTGLPRRYEGGLPADASMMAARNAGPCRADARLAWWLVTRMSAS